MSEIGVKLTGDNSEFRSMLDNSEQRSLNFAEKLTGEIGGIFKNFGATLLAGGMVGFFNSIIEKADGLQNLADRLNVSTDALQAMSHAASMAGASTEDTAKVWDRARLSVDKLLAGDEAITKAFETLHLSAQDLVGLRLDQSLEKIAAAYVENKDAAGAYAAVTEILGKSSPKLQAVLQDLGENGFGKLATAASHAGAIMTKDAVAAWDALGDTFTRLKNSVIGMTGSVLVELPKAIVNVMPNLGKLAASIMGYSDGLDLSVANTSRLVEVTEKLAPVLDTTAASYEAINRGRNAEKELNDYIAKQAYDELDTLGKLQSKYAERDAARQRANANYATMAEHFKAVLALRKLEAEIAKLEAQDDAEYAAARAGRMTVEKRALKEQSAIVKEIVDKTKERVLTEREVTAELVKQRNAAGPQNGDSVSLGRFGQSSVDYRGMSTANLEGLLGKYNAALNAPYLAGSGFYYPSLRQATPNDGGAFAAFQAASVPAGLISDVLNRRREIQTYAGRYGENAARGLYGDSYVNEALRDMATVAQNTLVTLNTISSQLSSAGLLPSQSAAANGMISDSRYPGMLFTAYGRPQI